MPALSLTLCAGALSGCSQAPLLDPKGPIGGSELAVIGVAFALMLVVVVPVLVMALWFPRRYSASNPKGDYDPGWTYSSKLDLTIWLVPAAIVMVLGGLAWTQTHRLDPAKAIDPAAEGVRIQAVALDWKWLFIYPDRNIAAVNRLVIPAGIPVRMTVTSDTVITSFFIPRLGSQVYAMAGGRSRLHLLADTQGTYFGQNQQFSGPGYADMDFKVQVTSPEAFRAWVSKVRRSPRRLDEAAFVRLRTPATGRGAAFFSWVKPGLFADVVNRYRRVPQTPVRQPQGNGR